MNTRIAPGDDPPATPFLNTHAVETWDTWFRWREDGQLRDLTIEATWERVAATLAGAGDDPGYRRRLIDAFTAWHLLLDERVIATAGTAPPQWSAGDLCAVLNAASFVRAPGLRHASFDYALFEEVATLAVRALDDAAILAGNGSTPTVPGMRIGIIGIGDALALLDVDYDSDRGRALAAHFAQSLARGSLAGSLALARERGARVRCDGAWSEQAQRRGYPDELIAEALHRGLRQGRLTAITSQPRLASFANGVADALDPLAGAGCHQEPYATAIRRTRGDAKPASTQLCSCVAAQLQLRAAVQPWIDARIDYPLSIERAPDASEIESWNTLARELGLAPPSWRLPMRGGHGSTRPAPA